MRWYLKQAPGLRKPGNLRLYFRGIATTGSFVKWERVVWVERKDARVFATKRDAFEEAKRWRNWYDLLRVVRVRTGGGCRGGEV